MTDLSTLYQALGLDGTARDASRDERAHAVRSPIDGAEIARLALDSADDVGAKVARAADAFDAWRRVPAPVRGELVRLFAEALRAHKDDLGALVTVECGKILEEGKGEVQEMIDICDFAVGLSRQLYGLTIASERPGHKMMETWHPLGPVGVITAFNFPVAPWAWNLALALVCGDPMVWKPSELTPLCALACRNVFDKAVSRFGDAPADLLQIVIGAKEAGEALVDDARLPLISATGSCAIGRAVGARVAARLGRSLLELGGNNGMLVAPSADLDLAERAILFAAVGTAGQRCTSLRRLIVHEDIYDALLPRLKSAYASVSVGDPLGADTLIGPLIHRAACDKMRATLDTVACKGGAVTGGERALAEALPDAYLRDAGHRRDARPDRDRARGDLRAHPLRHDVPRPGRRHRHAQRRAPGTVVVHLHHRLARGRDLHLGGGFGLRHRQRQHRTVGRRDRRCLRWREGHRRRPRIGLGRVEELTSLSG